MPVETPPAQGSANGTQTSDANKSAAGGQGAAGGAGPTTLLTGTPDATKGTEKAVQNANGNQAAAGNAAAGTGNATDQAAKDAAAKALADAGKTSDGTKNDQNKTTAEVKYDLKLKEGSALDQSAIDEIAAFSKAQGLSNEAAQALLEREDGIFKGVDAAHKDAVAKQQSGWVDAIKADKEIGGDNFTKSVDNGKRAIDRFASQALKDILNSSGLGNHPEFVRIMSKIGAAMADDKLVHPASGDVGQKSHAEILYPNLPK